MKWSRLTCKFSEIISIFKISLSTYCKSCFHLSREFVKCNRGNDLLVQLLSHRYPNLCREEAQITALWNFLASISNVQKEILSSLPTKQKEAALQAFLEGDRTTFPSDLGDDNSDLTSEEKTVYLLSLVKSTFSLISNAY